MLCHAHSTAADEVLTEVFSGLATFGKVNQLEEKGELLHRLCKDATRLQIGVQQMNSTTLKIQKQATKTIYLLFHSVPLNTNLGDILVTECNGQFHFVNMLQ